MPAKPAPPPVRDVTPEDLEPRRPRRPRRKPVPAPESLDPPDIIPVEPPLEDAIRLEIEQAVVKMFEWFGILDATLMAEIKKAIDVGAPGRLRPRLYDLFRARIGTVKLQEIIEYGIEGTLKNLKNLEGGTDTSMSDLA